ncbi:MAG: nitroreductase [Lactobacillus sp.]|nr:nitroreductase [Lactobacillus sp.]
MDFDDVYASERVTRKFSNKRVSSRQIKQIIQLAQQSPSLLNSQPWRVYAITDKPLRQLRSEFAEWWDRKEKPYEDFTTLLKVKWNTFATQNIANFGAAQAYFFYDKINLFNESNRAMFNAPCILYLTVPKDSPYWSVYDLGIFSQSIMLNALNCGLGVMPAHNLVAYPDLIRKYVPIPDDEMVAMGIGIGYKDENAEVNHDKFIPSRLPIDTIYKMINK